jgi:hypothetical protein
MGQYRLIRVDDNGDKTLIAFNDEQDLDSMCRYFTYFLRANSFIFDEMAEVSIDYSECRDEKGKEQW